MCSFGINTAWEVAQFPPCFLLKFYIILNESLTLLVYFKLLGVQSTSVSGQDKKLFLFHVVRDCETISGTSFLFSNQPIFIQVTFFTHCCICFLSLPVIQRCVRRRYISFVTSSLNMHKAASNPLNTALNGKLCYFHCLCATCRPKNRLLS